MLLIDVFAAVLTVWFPPLADILFRVGELLCRLMTAYTARLASLSLSQMIANGWMIVWLILLVVTLIYGYIRYRMRGIWWVTVVMSAVLLVGSGIYACTARAVSVVAAASSKSIVMSVRTDDTNGLILAPGSNVIKEASALLGDEGIRTLDWVLWLGTDEQPMPDLSELSVSITHLLVVSPPETYRALPSVRMITEFQSGGSLAVGEAACVERCEGFVRLCIGGRTVCLLVTDDEADASTLPIAWRDTDWLCTETVFDNYTDVRAVSTVVFCSHSKVATMTEAFPQAIITVKEDVQHLRLQTDKGYATMPVS